MDRKARVKIARELVALARMMVEEDQCMTAKWDWRHPFTFDRKQQDINELEKGIKDGTVDDTILVKFEDCDETSYESLRNSHRHECLSGEIVAPEDVDVKPSDLGLDDGTGRNGFQISIWDGSSSCDIPRKFKGCTVEISVASRKVAEALEYLMFKRALAFG